MCSRDTLAPFLFTIILDYALRNAVDGGETELGLTLQPPRARRHPAKALTDLVFADRIWPCCRTTPRRLRNCSSKRNEDQNDDIQRSFRLVTAFFIFWLLILSLKTYQLVGIALLWPLWMWEMPTYQVLFVINVSFDLIYVLLI